MSRVIKGVVKGNVIIPEDPVILPEGAEVIIEIDLPSNLRLLKHAGVWRNLGGLDELVEDIYRTRTIKKEVSL